MDNKMPVTNEVLSVNQHNMELKIDALTAKVEALPSQIDHSYIRADIFDLRMKEMDTQILAIRADMLRLGNRKSLINWITPTISAVLGSVLTYLIISQLNK